MIPQEIIEQMRDYAVDRDWNFAFAGKAKGNQHLFRVVIIAHFLAAKEEAQQDICEASAWLHDLSLVDGNDDNPLKVRASVEKFLATLPLDDENRRRIAECAETHEGVREAVSLEAKVVYDADALDKMGVLGVIRHTWKIVNLIEPSASAERIYFLLRKHLRERKEKLYTETARKLVQKLDSSLDHFFENDRKAMQLLEKIIQFARSGITSDDIAKALLAKDDIPTLAWQLCVTNTQLEDLYMTLEQTKISVAV